jgi:excisionase family DNA binding protein
MPSCFRKTQDVSGRFKPIDEDKDFQYFDVMTTSDSEGPEDFKFMIRNVFFEIKRLALWELEVGHTVTGAEAADYLGVSKQRINQLIDAERIRSAKFGRNILVPLGDLKAYREMVESGKAAGGRGHKAVAAIGESS